MDGKPRRHPLDTFAVALHRVVGDDETGAIDGKVAVIQREGEDRREKLRLRHRRALCAERWPSTCACSRARTLSASRRAARSVPRTVSDR